MTLLLRRTLVLLDKCSANETSLRDLIIKVPGVEVSDTTGDATKNSCWRQNIFYQGLGLNAY